MTAKPKSDGGDAPTTIEKAAAYLAAVETPDDDGIETLDEAAELAAPPEPAFEVALPDGSKAELPVSEIIAGYQRRQDYEAQTAELTVERQALAAMRRRLRDLAEHAEALRPEHVMRLLPPLALPDPVLAETDPAAYGRQRAAADVELTRRQQLLALLAEETQQREARMQADRQSYEAEQHARLLAAWPELGGPDSADRLLRWRQALSEHYGLAPDEIDLMADYRLKLMARDAMRWRQAEAEARAATPARPPAPRTPAPAGRDARDGTSALLERIGKSGSRERDMRLAAQYLMS